MIIKPIILTLTVGGLAFVAGCSDEAVPLGDDKLENPEGLPFVKSAVLISDLCGTVGAQSCELAKHPPLGATMVAIAQPEPGRVCVSGSVGTGGYAFTILRFSDFEWVGQPGGHAHVENPLNAEDLGIAKVSFKLDGPPRVGLVLGAAALTTPECSTESGCLLTGFRLTNSVTKEVTRLDQDGSVTAVFADFHHPDDYDRDFDTNRIDGISLGIDAAGAIDFCLSDLKFLDSEGNEVSP